MAARSPNGWSFVAFLVFVGGLAIGFAAGLPAQTRVACLGDSITFGAQVADREHNAYPAQLGVLLGEAFEVRNFGVGGATLLRRADRPFMATERFANALAWRPHVAVVILGTNDSCQNERRDCWQHHDDLAADARALIAALQGARADVRVVLCSPPPMFPAKNGLASERAADLRARAPRLRQVAATARAVAAAMPNVEYLELGRTLRSRDVTDGVHTSPFGAERIARRVAEAIAGERGDRLGLDVVLQQRGIEPSPTAFHEFSGWIFTLPQTGAACRVFEPFGPAAGAPWILRARFFGHQPALDLALLERGFHLAYCDVAELYGSPAAIERWDELYDLLHGAGLADRVVLEGMSRGGLPIVNWAAAHPERVAAIYGDNPVADFRSWPGGQTGKRSDADWQRCLAAYGLDEASAKAFDRMPVDRLAPIAAAAVPLLLVLGEDDTVVPPAENGDVLASRYRELGGPVQVWRKPGQGHHPHGLDPVDPLLRAVLRATGTAHAMPTTLAAGSAEYRRGAGWGDSTWWGQVAQMRALAASNPEIPIAFFGDSITQGLTGARDRLAKAGADRAIDVAFGAHGAISLGLSGDRTEHLLHRIRVGALREIDPRVIVLQIGVNNIHSGGHTAVETAAGIQAVVRSLCAREPQAQVVVCGPLPSGRAGSPQRATNDGVHARIADLDDGHRVFYRDLRPLFLDRDGRTNDRMRGDRVHITRAGQDAWMQAIAPFVAELLAGAGPFAVGVGIAAPNGAVQLVNADRSILVPEKPGAPSKWTFTGGVLTASPAWDSVVTPESYGDFRMHVEFNVNEAEGDNPEARGNSGVYIQQRYEIQILDSFGVRAEDYEASFGGSLYRLKQPDRLASRPPGEWQSYDIVFRAARFDDDGNKTANARITAFWNGALIHDDCEIPRKTGAGRPEGPEPLPIKLQGHHNEVRFRNVWVQALDLSEPSARMR